MGVSRKKYLQITAYVLIVVILVLVMGVTRNCSHLSTAPTEGHSGGDTLDIAVLFGPGSLYFTSDTLSGINIEIAKKFSEETGRPIKIWPVTDPAKGMTNLEEGAFDVLASLPLDNYIKNRFPVSESIFLDRLVLVQLTDSATGEKSVNTSLDLNGKEVYVAAGSSALNRMSNLSKEIGGSIEVTELPDLSDELLTLKVANGSLPLAVVNEKVARHMAEEYPRLNYESTVSFTQFQVWVFNPGDSIVCRDFNEWFDTFRTGDAYRSIINSY